jgi:6-pyruvoyltetrahydropterin/6-carboxytetrahydropterin synthase
MAPLGELWVWKVEPTAENILLYIRDLLRKNLPPGVVLRKLRIFETEDSYAEWEEREAEWGEDKMC